MAALALAPAVRRLPGPRPRVARRLRRPRLPLSAPAGRGARGRLRGRPLLRARALPRRPPRRHGHGGGGAAPAARAAGRRGPHAARDGRARGRPRRQPRPAAPGRLAGGGAGGGRWWPDASSSATSSCRARAGPSVRSSAPRRSLAAGLLAAPQLLPTLVLAREAGRSVTGLANRDRPLPGLFGLVLRYASHTPAPPRSPWPRCPSPSPRPRSACWAWPSPSASPCSGDAARSPRPARPASSSTSPSASWPDSRSPRSGARGARPQGARLRAYFLVAALASAAVLSVAAAAVGPLPESLAGAVGVLALSLILYFSLATSPHTVRAGLWLLPLTVSFLLQPGGRRPWELYPTQADLYEGSATRRALWNAMGAGAHERTLALVARLAARPGEGPRLRELDGPRRRPVRRTATTRWSPCARGRPWAAMGVGGTLPGAFFRSEPRGWRRSACAGCRCRPPRWSPRASASPATPWTSSWSRGGGGSSRCPSPPPPRSRSSRCSPTPSASRRDARSRGWRRGWPPAALRAQPARRAWTPRSGPGSARTCGRASRTRARPVFDSWTDPGGGFAAHRYLGRLRLPGRYLVDGVSLEARPDAGRLLLARLAVFDALTGALTPVSLPAAFVSDSGPAGRARGHAAGPPLRGRAAARGPGWRSGARDARRRRGGPARAGACRPRSASTPSQRGVRDRGRRARADASPPARARGARR